MQRLQCPIYKLQRYPWNLYIIKYVEETLIFLTLKSVYFCEFLRYFFWTRNVEVTFTEEPQIKINSLKKQKNWILIHTWTEKAFKGTVVYPLTVPLNLCNPTFLHN